MHQHKILLQVFMAEQIKVYQKGRKITQEIMVERLHISPRYYTYLVQGTYGCSATTLMFFFLILTDEEVIQLRMDFRTQVERKMEHEVA